MKPPLASQADSSLPSLAPQQKLAAVRVVLSHTSHPGNIGAAARAMKTMGLSRLVLVNPKSFPDAEASARAVGASDILDRAIVCASLDEALAGSVFAIALSARPRNLGPAPMPAREAVAEIIARAGPDAEVALVFGNETAGLSNADVQRCQRSVYIPTDADFRSLNLGAAVQLLSYELRLAAFGGQEVLELAGKTVPFASPPATHEDVERLYAHLESVMVATGFLDPKQPKRLMPKLRRLFGRSGLERDEVNILRGLLDAVDKKIGKG
jgi:tRNA/rRNA methyltransferase